MPIYAYRCAACGHARDVLQKLSDPVLSVCPVCGAEQFQKQVTAAGFQLKGSGWYATDFRNNQAAAGSKPAEGNPAEKGEGGSAGAGAAAAAGGGAATTPSGDSPSSATSSPSPSPSSSTSTGSTSSTA